MPSNLKRTVVNDAISSLDSAWRNMSDINWDISESIPRPQREGYSPSVWSERTYAANVKELVGRALDLLLELSHSGALD